NDILFILFLFLFIAATLANPNAIILSQPKAKSDTKAEKSIFDSVDANKIYYVGTTLVETDTDMRLALMPFIVKDDAEANIVINADKSVPLEYVVAVMRIARDLGAKTVLAVDRNAQ